MIEIDYANQYPQGERQPERRRIFTFFKPSKLWRKLMTIEDDVLAIKTSIANLETQVAAISTPAPATVDLSSVLAAIADVRAQLSATPAAPVTPPPAA